MAPSLSHANGGVGPLPSVGILTKTVVRSPVIHWVLHARLRHKSLNDAVLVGSDFIHVREVGQQGHLEHIATKDDFDAQIRAATVLSIDPDPLDEDFLVKVENRDASQTDAIVPPDLLVLTLSTNDLVFLYLETRRDGTLHFVHQTLPLPVFDRILFQPGEHVAVDPHFRALTVAANEREVIIYSAKPLDRIVHEIRSGDQNWCPVAAQRPLQVEGVIQHVDFLIPPEEDEDHIVLLLLVVHQCKTKAIWIDWYHATDLHHAQIHRGEPLYSSSTVSSLLIPLRNAAFLIVVGSEVRKYSNILSGSITGVALGPLVHDPADTGNSPLQPLWASWCRPHRHRASRREKDHIYLVREDGLVLYIYAMVEGNISNIAAGHLKCHVGKAFASLGQTTGPDILAVAGEMSAGRVVSIGHWGSPNGARVDRLSWRETMEMELIQIMPNWASATDILTPNLRQSHGSSPLSRHGISVTSGRQPYGSITGIRYGLEARAWAQVELNDLHSVTAMWAVPMASNGSLLVLMATPSSTRAFELNAKLDFIAHDDTDALDLHHRTLAAAIRADGRIVQVTEQSVCETSSLTANFEDTTMFRCVPGDCIISAAIDGSNDLLVTAEQTKNGHVLCGVPLPLAANTRSAESRILAGHAFILPSAPLAVAVAPRGDKSLAAVATAENGVIFFVIDAGNVDEVCRVVPPSTQDTPGLCDHLVLLRRQTTSDILALCGLRDGRLFGTEVGEDINGEIHCDNSHVIDLGQSAVRVVGMAEQPSQACVMSGSDTCLITWDGPTARSLSVESVWYSDKNRPELAQDSVAACAQVPSSDFLISRDFAASLLMVSGGELLVANLGSTPGAVPRQILVTGTPNRLLYAEQQRCSVVASLQTCTRAFPTPNAKPEERRQIWPTIDFIPSRGSEPSFSHDLQPGERVYALLEWSYKEDDKTYSFVLVGGSYVRRNGSQGGRIAFLQPGRTGWKVTSVREGPVTRFEAPVYALSLYDELTYVVCYGQHVCLYRFSPKERKWEPLCPPLALAHSGVYVTIEAPLIYVSTNGDSLVTLQLIDNEGEEDGTVGRKLVLVSSSPQADRALSHVVMPPPSPGTECKAQVALVSTRDRWIVGLSLRSPVENASRRSLADDLLFKAYLPRSLTRIRQSNIRPAWKAASPEGVIADNIIGVASDGTLVGIAVLDEQLWRRLCWLQKLCGWSELLSPHSCHTPLYNAADTSFARDERALPIGLSGCNKRNEIMLRTSIDSPADKHIDGDVLARLLQRGGAETLRSIVRKTAERDDHAGTWTREHLKDELGAVDEIVSTLRVLLYSWM